MVPPRVAAMRDNQVTQLIRLSDEGARRRLVRRSTSLHHPAMVEWLYEEVLRRAHADLQQAERLAEAADWIAVEINDDASRAVGWRALGHIRFLRGQHKQALKYYRAALVLFRRLGRDLDVGRTLNGALQCLIYLGKYDQALDWAQKAREIFKKHRDRLRLARLDSNMGNLLYRQDRFAEALLLYERASRELRRLGQARDVAAALSNIAVCYISLNDFVRAEQCYRTARQYCVRHHFPLLVAEADYNIAYLYYLRGEYTRAIEMYQEAREHCDRVGDIYHRALCDLDQSELYLEVNLSEEGSQLARQALAGFKELDMGYEAAKAQANLAIAAGQRGQLSMALEQFEKARTSFLHQQNRIWPALIDLYQALVLYQGNRFAEARRLAQAALKFFSHVPISGKAALCELLLARLYLHEGQTRRAGRMCRAALHRLGEIESPALSYQTYFVLGQIQEARGNQRAALQAYQNAHQRLENLRSQISAEELKIAFLKDKLSVYESLVQMRLGGAPRQPDRKAAFLYIEQAKSRSLADLIAFRAQSLPAPRTAHRQRIGEVHQLRQELNWFYHQIDLQGMRQGVSSRKRLEALRHNAREVENRLLQTFSTLSLRDKEFSSLQQAGSIRLQDIQSKIPPGTMLLEYFHARGTLYACLLSRKRLTTIPLAKVSKVRDVFRLLQFQLSKFRLGPSYIERFASPLLEATLLHLLELYRALIAPFYDQLNASHLVVVPHNFLHYLPFHALFDGERFLIDRFSISYAPSASVYFLCCSKNAVHRERSLVLGIPDPVAPQIREEVKAVAASLPHSQLFLGKEATERRLRRLGASSRFVHIATHGLFRQDNPMFSSIHLGDSTLSLFDLYHLNLSAELVTLSGCATGSNVVVGGDELLGLVRGLLYAGAHAVLVTLWDVNDQSTAEFMKSFYRHLFRCDNKAEAVRLSLQELRQKYPHPYYWAPFVMIGNVMPI